MSCEEFLQNVSRMLNGDSGQSNMTEPTQPGHREYMFLKNYVYGIGLPIICSFGVIGNILNLIVLTRKQLQKSMDRMEKSAHLGLVALAVVDLMFCAIALPIPFIKSEYLYTSLDSWPRIFFNMYNQSLLNIFLFCSNWLTVVMASARYLAICYPLHARGFINIRGTRIAIALVFIISILLNLPKFFYYGLKTDTECAAHCTCYHRYNTDLYRNPKFMYPYKIIWAVLGTFIPFAILAFCNCCLIRALRRSLKMQRLCRANNPPRDSGHHITPTLITIVVLFFVLVSPSEILKFIEEVLVKPGASSHYSFNFYQSATIITNFMQACNFAINFVLYCIINVHFRETIAYVFCCRWTKSQKMRQSYTKANASTTNQTYVTDMETEI